jgi:glyoxylase-like metal-dependent hydrolase (beta-lactamase superfamily II)
MVKEVAKSVYMLSLAWSNVYILKEGQNVALIDTGLQKDRPAILRGLAELGVSEKQVGAVYLTHAHTDHGGNAAYFARQGARLHVHEAEAPYIGVPRRTYLLPGWRGWTRPFMTIGFWVGEWLYAVERYNPDVVLTEDMMLDAPGGALRVVFSPGHSPGHAAYFRESDGTLFSGDSILTLIPISRANALSLPLHVFSTDWAQTKQSARRVAALGPRALLAGHGWPLTENTADRVSAWAETLH